MNGSFDDLTLAEVQAVQTEALDGKRISDDDVDPLLVAAGAMWKLTQRDKPEMTFDEFRETVTMGDMKRFSERADTDPTNGH